MVLYSLLTSAGALATLLVLPVLVAITGTSDRPAAFICVSSGSSWWSRSAATITSGGAAFILAMKGAKSLTFRSTASVIESAFLVLASSVATSFFIGLP